jgi:heme/copper-type cytochrome/quinol oxidase subunit 4
MCESVRIKLDLGWLLKLLIGFILASVLGFVAFLMAIYFPIIDY